MSPNIPVSVGTVTIRSRSKTCGMKLSARQNFVLKKKKDLHRLAEALQMPGALKC